MHRTTALIVAAAMAAVLGAAGAAGLTGSASYDLPTGRPVAPAGRLVFASGEVLHLGSRTQPIRPAPETMVATAGGLYYLADQVLWHWRPGADRSTRVARIGSRWLSTTADGRYLAYVDFEHGPRTLRGQRVAEVVLADTTTGRELVRDAAGNGARTSAEDLSDRYAESPPTILGFDDDGLYAHTAVGGPVVRWALSDGTRSDLGDDDPPPLENQPGGAVVDLDLVEGVAREVPGPGTGAYQGRRSPGGGRLAFTVAGRAYVQTDGDPAPLALPVPGRHMVLAAWLDDDRLVALGVDETRGRAQVLICSVPARGCEPVSRPVPAEDGRLPVFGTGDFPY